MPHHRCQDHARQVVNPDDDPPQDDLVGGTGGQGVGGRPGPAQGGL